MCMIFICTVSYLSRCIICYWRVLKTAQWGCGQSRDIILVCLLCHAQACLTNAFVVCLFVCFFKLCLLACPSDARIHACSNCSALTPLILLLKNNWRNSHLLFHVFFPKIEGTLGQPSPWYIGQPSTYHHPLAPEDVLSDPFTVTDLNQENNKPMKKEEAASEKMVTENETKIDQSVNDQVCGIRSTQFIYSINFFLSGWGDSG